MAVPCRNSRSVLATRHRLVIAGADQESTGIGCTPDGGVAQKANIERHGAYKSRQSIHEPRLAELSESNSEVVLKLQPASETAERPVPLSESEFRWQMNEDAMATEKTAEGIRGFVKDQIKLEEILSQKL